MLNRALGENRDKTPYRQLLDAGEKFFDDTSVAVGIYKDRMNETHDWFVIDFDNGKLDLKQHGKGEADMTCKIKQAHLEEVVEHPETYVNKPYKLDLDWLKKTVGLPN